ncbi:MAG: hypothetical protein EOL88_00670 [Bacteroidia bacterium]|nr:hypothetical protein [Bacteroidia bacterium]
MAKKTTKKIEEVKICGKTEGIIRKAYFEKRLPDLLDEIQAEDKWSEAEIEELGNYLEMLKQENKDFVSNVQKTFGGIILDRKPPSYNELMEGLKFSEEEEDKVRRVMDYVEAELGNMRKMINDKAKIPADYWLEKSAIFLSYEPLLNGYLIYKKQLYYGKITEIIDKVGCSRLEAENRAKLTTEYRDYKNIEKLVGSSGITGTIERFENISKKFEARKNYN